MIPLQVVETGSFTGLQSLVCFNMLDVRFP